MKTWKEVYSTINTIEDFVGNIVNHTPLLNEIFMEKPRRILEVGSGSGTLGIFLSYLGFKIVSIDNNKEVIELAKKHNKLFNGRVKFVKRDAFKLDFKRDSFELVYHQGFLEHFNSEEIIRLLEKQLEIAPIVIFSVPNNYYKHKDFGNEWLLSKKKWEQILSQFNVVKSENYYTRANFEFRHKLFWLKPTQYLAKIKRW